MSASRSSVAHNYFRPSLIILFTAFLETKPQLWKLMSAISGWCIGSSGSPMHPPLKIADRITKVSKTSPKINSETLTNEHNKEMLKERYLSPAERQKIIDDLRLI